MERGTARWIALLALIGMAILGCGERQAAKDSSPKKASVTVEREQSPEVSPTAYSSVPDALAAVEQMSASGNPSSQELMKVEQWLGGQGGKAVPELTTALADSNRNLAVRITACRALSRVGSAGKDPLLQASAAGPRQLRLKATECLGRIKPTDQAIVDKLVGLMDDKDFDQRKAAFTAIANIGPSASKADPKLVEKLMAILNDTKQDETIRGLAKTALKKVDPRTGLQDAH